MSTSTDPTTSRAAGPPPPASALCELLGWLTAWPPAAETLTGTDLADLLWLAQRMPEAPQPAARDPAHDPGEKHKPSHTPVSASKGSAKRVPHPPPEPPADEHDPPAFFPEPPPARTRERAAQLLPDRVLPRQRDLDAAIASLPVRLQTPRLLPPERFLLNALRPLMGRIAVADNQQLDEEATAERWALERLPIPVYQGRMEPRFSVTLLVDRGLSMEVWIPLAREFRDLLVRSGAFRAVHLVELIPPRSMESGGAVGLRPEGSRQVVWKSAAMLRSSPPPLAAEAQRSLLLVLSDTAGPHWWDGLMFEVLASWSARLPLAILQTLPRWMAERTALRGLAPAELHNDQTGACTSRYRVRDPDGWDDKLSRGGALPVLRLDPAALAPWAALVMGDGRLGLGGVRIPAEWTVLQQQLEPFRPEVLAPDRAQPNSAEELWRGFCRSATPEAQRLMMVLAAAPVLSLPVMRLIKEALLPPESGPLPLQEVLLSGLLQPIAAPTHEQGQQRPSDRWEPGSPELIDVDGLQYGVHAGVLELLRSDLSATDTVTVVRMVTGLLERRWNALGTGHSFRALLRDPDLEIEDDDLKGVVNFATATAELIERLPGEEYQRLARQLRGRSPQPHRQIWPKSMAFVSHGFTTAWLVEVPEIQAVRVETARLEDVPLQPIANAETWGFREPRLAAALTLVEIPAGTFLMGSPLDEPERFADEGPQHEVTLQNFFISQTPITQAQWREVAEWSKQPAEHWGHDLKPNPSSFSDQSDSDQRPVENVSWHDAMEFCNRMSQRTGRHYTLPSEAQWEYACRAGSATPFHFGATITPDLANYDGNTTYADGPKGVNRKQTTPVGMFPANAWGLHDMHGNVWEWCLDQWHASYEGAPPDGSAWLNTTQPTKKTTRDTGNDSDTEEEERLLRGGSWGDVPGGCRSACRDHGRPGDASLGVGFRVVCLPQGPSLIA
ncbi:formylglycine-generating enzyme family protein [Microcystis elabens FACHB-917]|nr:formylglycine-generating enzyme family protein [Microcystis elabens FACHB-917]